MTGPETPRYFILANADGTFTIVDRQTGQHLARTDDAAIAQRLVNRGNAHHAAEQARLEALSRASGRPR